MRHPPDVIIVLFMIAGGIVLVTHYLAIPWLTPVLAPVVFGLIGVAALIDGVGTVESGSMHFRFQQENYTGLPARLWGIWIFVVGVALLAAAVFSAFNPNWAEAAWHTPQGWGSFALLSGLLSGIYGIIRLLAGETYYRPEVKRPLQNLIYRVDGALMTLLGFLLLVLGAALVLLPKLFSAFFQ